MTKLYINTVFMLLLALSMTSCFVEEKNMNATSLDAKSKEVKKEEEDCDEEVAQKTLEKIKAEEYSLMNQNDAGCTTEEAKPVEIPTK